MTSQLAPSPTLLLGLPIELPVVLRAVDVGGAVRARAGLAVCERPLAQAPPALLGRLVEQPLPLRLRCGVPSGLDRSSVLPLISGGNFRFELLAPGRRLSFEPLPLSALLLVEVPADDDPLVGLTALRRAEAARSARQCRWWQRASAVDA